MLPYIAITLSTYLKSPTFISNRKILKLYLIKVKMFLNRLEITQIIDHIIKDEI